jgi:hypothetical protein
MADKWLGAVASGDRVTMVVADVPDDDGPIDILDDFHLQLQKGDRASALHVMHQQIANYAKENKVQNSIIKGSAVTGKGKARLSILESAELRGVTICALRDSGPVQIETKGHISNTFGERKVDDYVKDNNFWSKSVTGADLRAGSREAAILILAARGK